MSIFFLYEWLGFFPSPPNKKKREWMTRRWRKEIYCDHILVLVVIFNSTATYVENLFFPLAFYFPFVHDPIPPPFLKKKNS